MDLRKFRIRHPVRFFMIYLVVFCLAASIEESFLGGRGWLLGSVVIIAVVLIFWTSLASMFDSFGRKK